MYFDRVGCFFISTITIHSEQLHNQAICFLHTFLLQTSKILVSFYFFFFSRHPGKDIQYSIYFCVAPQALMPSLNDGLAA